jgi:hypothetical protein
MIGPSFDATWIDCLKVGICPDIDLKLGQIDFISRFGLSASSARGKVAGDKGVDSVSEIQVSCSFSARGKCGGSPVRTVSIVNQRVAKPWRTLEPYRAASQ